MSLKPFDQLTRAGQVGRIRQLALAALQDYPLPEPHLSLLKHAANTTFLLETGDNQRYLLRVTRAGAATLADLRSELLWLQALRRDTALSTPDPILTTVGSLLTTATAAGMPAPRHVAVFRWQPGKFYRAEQLTLRHLVLAGEFLATLHNYPFNPLPQGFTRPTYHADGLLRNPTHLDVTAARANLPADANALIDHAIEHFTTATTALGQTPSTYGLIHADFSEDNYLFDGDNLKAIGFDRSGWGWFLYDLAVTLSSLIHLPNYAELRAALLAGYTRFRPLSDDHLTHLPALIAARKAHRILWLSANRTDPAVARQLPTAIDSRLADIERLLA